MAQGVQTILGLGGQPHHLSPLGHQGAQLGRGFWRHPELRQQPCRVELGQDQGSLSVRLAPSTGDKGHVRWMDHGD